MLKKLAGAVVETIHESHEAEKKEGAAPAPSGGAPATKASSSKVTVCVRVRPRNQKELDAEMPVFFDPSEDGLNIQEISEGGNVTKNWSYDYCFGPDNDNKYIFHSVGTDLVDAALDGYNTVMFMYGQTSSGKTFTLFGGGPEHPGLVDYSLEYLNEKVNKSKDTEYLIKMTYSELYNEEIKDLLSGSNTGNLKIVDDPNLGPYVQNITEHAFKDAEGAKKALLEGEERRHFGVTNMNAHSSRSHVMVRITIECRKVNFEPTNPLRGTWGRDKPTSVATLNLVDLAGSERANKSGTSGASLKEGSFINKSLLTLGTVIFNLSEGTQGSHVPYRNSKLTRLLSTALGGNARTTMVTCISPASGNVLESLSTLRFASRAKKIVNQVKKNEVLDAKTLHNKLSMQNDIIEQLKAKLAGGGGLSGDGGEGGDGGPTSHSFVKESAVRAAKDMRSLKALISSTPRIVKSLRDVGLVEMADQVAEDLKLGLAGKKDLGEIITNQAELLALHVPTERELMDKLFHVGQKNEAEELYPTSSDRASRRGDGGEDGEGGAGLRSASGDSAEEYHDDDDMMDGHTGIEELFGSVFGKGGGGANREEVECVAMNREDLLSACGPRILSQEKRLSQLLSQHEALESKHSTLVRNHEATNKELTNARERQKTSEEDTARLRNEMKTQMEKLRSNMYTLLQDKGETAQVMAERGRQAEIAIDQMKDELEAAVSSKKRFKIELTAANNRVASLTKAEMAASREAQVLRMQLADSKKELEKLKLEAVGRSAKIGVLEQSEKKLNERIDALTNKLDRAEVNKKRDQKMAIEDIRKVRLGGEKRTQSLQHQLDMTLEDFRSEKRILEQKISQLQEDLNLAESRYDDLSASESRIVSRYEKIETSLRDEVALLTNYKEDSIVKIEALRSKLGTYESVIKRELELGAAARELAEDEEKEEGGMDGKYSEIDPQLSNLGLSAGRKVLISRQAEYLSEEPPELPAYTPEQEEAVQSSSFRRLKYGLQLATIGLRHGLKDSATLHRTEESALFAAEAALATTRREKAVCEDEVMKLQASCELYENEFSSARRNKDAMIAYVNELEVALERLRDDHERALHSEVEALAEQERLSVELNRLKIQEKRNGYESQGVREELDRDSRTLDQALKDTLDLKRRLLLAESVLGEKEQRLEVLQIERDELAKHFYKHDKEGGDKFTGFGIDSDAGSETTQTDAETDDAGRGGSHHHHRRHRTHYHHRSSDK